MTDQKRVAAQKAKEVLNPILDVFGGADGGVAFATLVHSILPNLYNEQNNPQRNPQIDDLLESVERFSRLCELALKGE